MLERLLITLIIGIVVVVVYRLLLAYQRRRVTVASGQTAPAGRARVLYFRSDTCGACRVQGHYLDQLDDLHRALVEPVEVEQAPELARQYNILTLPTTILIDQAGQVRFINPGLANPTKLTGQLEQLLK
jgi:thioredoxin-related protein